MRIDAHQHFWIYNPEEYSWISDSMKVLRKDFLPADLLPLLKQSGFDGSIAVQARQSREETRWLLELAGEHDFIKGVVGWVDLCSVEAESQLEEFTLYPKLVGVRHVLQDEPDDMFMLQDNFLKGISLLRKFNLVYELLIFPGHLPYAIQLVKKFPDQKFVLDHIAKPLIKDKILTSWKEGIQQLALQPNVSCKLSGMVTEAEWKGWRSSFSCWVLHTGPTTRTGHGVDTFRQFNVCRAVLALLSGIQRRPVVGNRTASRPVHPEREEARCRTAHVWWTQMCRHSGRVRSNGRVLGSVGARTSGLNCSFYRSFFHGRP